MTFKGATQAGFSGSIKKNFKITAVQIDTVNRAEGMHTIVASYSKAGAKPIDEIILTNADGIRLQNGRDYILAYKNNRAVADAVDEKAPTITVKGKGNYQGSFTIPFTITKADLKQRITDGDIVIKTTAAAYQTNKAESYLYKPAVRLLEGRTALRANSDYVISYRNNTQADYHLYMEKLTQSGNVDGLAPMAVITAPAESSYKLGETDGQSQIEIPLPIYQNRLSKANLSVEIAEIIYTGSQVRPAVAVTYHNEEAGRITLTENKDYTVSYGANIKSGNNVGNVTISGIGPYYGGDVTVKFAIQRKKILY